MNKLLIAVLICFSSATIAQNLTISEAKAQGLIGERTDGYIGYVVKPPMDNVKKLVKMVNNKRREKFSGTAKKNGISLKQVGTHFYQRAVKATKNSHFYQSKNGSWVRK